MAGKVERCDQSEWRDTECPISQNPPYECRNVLRRAQSTIRIQTWRARVLRHTQQLCFGRISIPDIALHALCWAPFPRLLKARPQVTEGAARLRAHIQGAINQLLIHRVMYQAFARPRLVHCFSPACSPTVWVPVWVHVLQSSDCAFACLGMLRVHKHRCHAALLSRGRVSKRERALVPASA